MKRAYVVVMIVVALVLISCGSTPQSTPEKLAQTATAQTSPTWQSSTPTVEATLTEESDKEIQRPSGWDKVTHGKSADPNYDVVFAQDKVNRIEITIDPQDWEAMQANMVALFGQAGSGSENPGFAGGDVPPGGSRPQPREDGAPVGAIPPKGRDRTIPPQGNPPGGRGFGGGDMTSENPTWVPATITFEGNTWTNVGVRYKGNSSLVSVWRDGTLKLPLKLDFDEFEEDYPEIDDQRFYGFKQLSLSSNFKDASFLREKVAADIFRDAGIAAAHTAFYQVYVDYGTGPVYFGLYTMTEIVEDTVIEEQFEQDDGNLYKPEGKGATVAAGTFSETAFDKETNADKADWSDILALFEALHDETRTSNPTAWRHQLESVFDVDGFLKWLAVNTVIQNWDTYGVMSHNYYLYHDPTTDLLTWIPWDNNEALRASEARNRGTLSLELGNVSADWPLIRYLLDQEAYYERYVTYIAEVAAEAFEPAKMEATYRQLADLVAPAALAENQGYTFLRSDAEFAAAVEALVEHAYNRADAVNAFLAIQPANEPAEEPATVVNTTLDTGPTSTTQGVVLVNGPTQNNNGPLDYMGTFNITGGFLVAAGSSGMAEAPSSSSTQYSVMYNFESPQSAGTIVHVETQDGKEVLTFVPTKTYQSVLLSSPELEPGSTYVLYTGGSSTGTVADGLYAGGTYSAGTQVASLTISSMVTSAGSSAGGFRGGQPGRP